MKNVIFITGGVVSSLGKGIIAASVARLLKDQGIEVNMMKCDPYLNVDPGTMSPIEHGEVYVTQDGGETDLDIGHYERFLGSNLTAKSSLTTGKVYSEVLSKERAGEYLGKTVQVVPHITNQIKDKILKNTENNDVLFVEVGGTVGDIESLPYLEAIRQLMLNEFVNTFLIHLTYVPYLKSSNELKTKPTQHSVRELQGLGITPNMIVTRNEIELRETEKQKISLFCNVVQENVIQSIDVDNIYKMPLILKEQNMDGIIAKFFGFKLEDNKHEKLENVLKKLDKTNSTVTIGVVGKYTQLDDSYKSVIEALKHGGLHHSVAVNIKLIKSQNLTDDLQLDGLDGIIVPGGFGESGIDGKLYAIKYARENKIPFLGICLGMQLAVMEYAQNVVKEKVYHGEVYPDEDNFIITLMNDQDINHLGGTLRLGNYECELKTGSKIEKYYNSKNIVERHRHRYEFNNKYKELLSSNGMEIVGINKERNLVEAIEINDHPFFIAVQYHPEFTSKLTEPNALFKGLVGAAKGEK